jgi:hypothetical protein
LTDSNDERKDNAARERPGIGVDAQGGGVIDPTKNVMDLVLAQEKYQNGMREGQEKIQRFALEAANTFHNFARDMEAKLSGIRFDAESRRIDQLADIRMVYEKRIADMLNESVRSTSALVSTQLVQIQATFNDRVSKLEEFRWSSSGRSSVSDPALANALEQLGATIAALKTSEDSRGGRGTGRNDMYGWLLAGVAMIATVVGLLWKHGG